jgi:hypothetical protein
MTDLIRGGMKMRNKSTRLNYSLREVTKVMK